MSLRKQARQRLLILLTGLFLIILLGGGWLARGQIKKERQATKRRADGMAAFAAADYSTAAFDLGVYLLSDPTNLDVLDAYSKAQLKIDTPQSRRDAEHALRQIISLAPDRVDDWRQLMQIEFRFQKWTEANQAADGLLNLLAGDGEALSVKATALNQLRRYAEALDAAKARLAIDPSDVRTQLARLFAMAQLHSPPASLVEIGESLVKSRPNDQGALVVEAFGYRMNNELDKAQAALRAAAQLPTTDQQTGMILVHDLDSFGLYSESLRVLTALAQHGDAGLRQALLRRLWEQTRLGEVIALLNSPVKESLQDSESLGIYADTLRMAERHAEFSAELATLSSRQNDPVAAAWVAVENAESSGGHDGLVAERAACANVVSQIRPDPYLMYFEGKANTLLGETDAAIDLWTKSAELARTWSLPLVDKAMALLSTGRRDLAEQAAAQAFSRAPYSNRAAIAVAAVWFSEVESGNSNPLDQLNSMIDEIQKHVPGEEQTLLMRVSLQARAGNTQDAIKTAQLLIHRQPPASAHSILELANVSRQWKLGIETDCLAAIEKAYGRTPESVLSQAIDDYLNNNREAGLKLLRDAVASAGGDDLLTYRLALASFLEMTHDPSATETWKTLGDGYPDSIAVQRAALASPSAYRDPVFYGRTIDRAQKLFGDDSIGWKIAKSRWLLDSSKDAATAQQASDLLTQVVEHSPDSFGANVLLGIAKERLGDLSGAAAQLKIAQRLNPHSTTVALDLARMQQYLGDFDAARQQLDIAANAPANPQQQAETAMMLAAQGDVKQAIKIMEPLVNENGPEDRALALASLYCRDRDFDQAQAICNRLLQHPDPSSVLLSAQLCMCRRDAAGAAKALSSLGSLKQWKPGELEETCADFYYGFADFGPALTLYRDAAAAAPANPWPWLSEIDCQAALGNEAAALATLTEALKHFPNDPHLNSIHAVTDLLENAGDSTMARQLASALVRDPSPDGPAAKTLRAVEQIAHSDDPTDGGIIPPLRKLADDEPRFLPGQIALVETQLRLGRAEDAIDGAERLVQGFPSDVTPCELAVRALSAAGRWDDALQMARTWRDRVVGDATNVDVNIAQLQLHTGDINGAMQTIQPYINSVSISPAQKWQMLAIKANVLVAQGDPDGAAKLLWPVIQADPHARAEWIGFVAISFPPVKAEQWLNRMSDLLKSEKNSEPSQLDLCSGWETLAARTGDRHYGQIAEDLAIALEQTPSVAGDAEFKEGAFREENNDYAGAEKAYRSAIQHNRTQARNNLAVMLAHHGGSLTEAIDLARQCVKDDPNQATYWDTLADLLSQDRQFDPAVTAIRAAVRLEPDRAKWRVNLANILILDGHPDQARRIVADLDLMSPGIHSLTKEQSERLDAVRKILANAPAASILH